jgi:hypothetical protein
MRKFSIISVLAILCSVSGIGQVKNDSMPEMGLVTIAWANHGNSYITFPTDIGNVEPLWFEANLIPNFYIRVRKDSRLMGVVTPQIIIRMYREESFPVRTPSYIPQLTLYYLLSNKEEYESISTYGKIAHHSNGQEGDFLLENGDINLLNGSFSTNYYEFGLIKTMFNSRYNAVQFMSTSLQKFPPILTDDIDDMYSPLRWNTVFSIFKIPTDINNDKKKNASISFKGKTTWMFGDVNDWKTFSLDRLNLSLTFYYHPKFLEDIGFFAQVYHGMDYYNIYFSHQINIIRFGIMTEKLRF